MKKAEYSTLELQSLLENLSGMYDLTRVVDPTECRVLEIHPDGRISHKDRCYNVWNSDQRCMNCSSASACRTGCHRDKSERVQDKIFDIESNPVSLIINDGTRVDAVVELISIREGDDEYETERVNDREAENVENHAVRYHASHDSLTGVLNADVFYERARAILLDAPDITWVIVTGNIKEFRLVNNLFGIEKGNELLVKAAEVLKRIADEAEGLCARISGDHFALLIPKKGFREESLDEAVDTISALCTSSVYTLRMHFGIYSIRDTSVPVSVMCDRANIALRTIKGDVRSTAAYFNEEMMKKLIFEQEVISRFEHELREDRFHMYLQPLCKKDGTPVGAEALVRWIWPDGTIVPPGDFIEILERAGLIPELDFYIWEQAAKQLSLWKDTDKKNMTISVNMSARDFYNADIYSVLTDLIRKYDVDCSRLRLEITETALLKDPERSGRIISRLRNAGFIIEIDDFGKGHSSLSMLKDIRADIIKIDMGFLQDTEHRERSRIIVGSVIGMTKSLGMVAVTEGVETERQLEALDAMGCDLYQGFFFSRPLPVERFEEYYQQHTDMAS